jgi:hypothetical protein
VLRAWIELSRPSQWVKNLALFVAPLFGRALSTGFASGALPWTFLAFCAFASAGYAVNDRLDVAADRRHADKRRRPFARGAVTRAAVTGIVACWTAIGVVAAWCAEGGAAGSFAFALSYFAGTLAYSFVLKRLFVVDVLALAGLFVVRIYAGACAAGVPVSPWLAACSVLGACVVGFGKRLAEVDRSLAVFEPARDRRERRRADARHAAVVPAIGAEGGRTDVARRAGRRVRGVHVRGWHDGAILGRAHAVDAAARGTRAGAVRSDRAVAQ